jgi:hypothetical protein
MFSLRSVSGLGKEDCGKAVESAESYTCEN